MLVVISALRISFEGIWFGIPVKRLGLVVSDLYLASLIGITIPSHALKLYPKVESSEPQRWWRRRLLTNTAPNHDSAPEISRMAAATICGFTLLGHKNKAVASYIVRGVGREKFPTPNELSEEFICVVTDRLPGRICHVHVKTGKSL